ncbi:hypothetical protein ACEWY4_004233 [Coilia grayii]|uniref:Bcr-Abl oncoprotein oligomerisation domain-containing protein n=1 Tax=Coilia grayii TaxID=363190 RepID=A0ABD1KKY0_9TELE
MVEPVGFIEAWKAQFPESEPPKMELRSVGGIELELEKCKASIRRLEMEVNKERFRMIYLQTLLAKERKSYDRQRWGFRKAGLMTEMGEQQQQQQPMGGAGGDPQQPPQLHAQEQGERSRFQPMGETRSKPRPPPARKSASHGDGLEIQSAFEPVQPGAGGSGGGGGVETDGLSPSKQPRGGVSPRRPHPPPEKDLPSDPSSLKDKPGMGLGVAALRSNFERIKRANSHSSADGKGGQQEKQPFYANMEFHHERGLVRVNDREVSEKIGSLGTQAMQMERKRSLHSLPGNLATVAGELRPRPVYRGRSTESTCGYDAEYEDGEPSPRYRANGGKQQQQQPPQPPPWQPSEYQPYTSVYVGGMVAGEGVVMREHGGGDDHQLTWPRRSYSPGSFDDAGGGGGGYTPDCSSNENLTSSEEDFSSGQSSHVSPSPTAAYRRPFRDKSRSPSQNSQNSQHSFDSSSPPTPQSQKRHRQQQQQGHVVVSEATIVGVRKTGQIWPPHDGDSTPSSRASHDNSFHGDMAQHSSQSSYSLPYSTAQHSQSSYSLPYSTAQHSQSSYSLPYSTAQSEQLLSPLQHSTAQSEQLLSPLQHRSAQHSQSSYSLPYSTAQHSTAQHSTVRVPATGSGNRRLAPSLAHSLSSAQRQQVEAGRQAGGEDGHRHRGNETRCLFRPVPPGVSDALCRQGEWRQGEEQTVPSGGLARCGRSPANSGVLFYGASGGGVGGGEGRRGLRIVSFLFSPDN